MPLDSAQFKRTGDALTLLQISKKDQEGIDTATEIEAIKDQGMEVFRTERQAGRVHIEMNIPEGKNLLLLVWVARNNAVPTYSCGGSETWLTDTSNPT